MRLGYAFVINSLCLAGCFVYIAVPFIRTIANKGFLAFQRTLVKYDIVNEKTRKTFIGNNIPMHPVVRIKLFQTCLQQGGILQFRQETTLLFQY